jgi:diguanylate cyclase
MLVSVATMVFAARVGLMAWPQVAALSVFCCLGNSLQYALVRSGASDRLADPSMTMVQMVNALVCCAWAYAIGGPLRGAIFPVAMTVLAFAMFSLPRRQVAVVSAVAVLLHGLAMGLMAWRQPERYPPAVEAGHFLIVLTTVPLMALLAVRVGVLRGRLQAQRGELTQALERIQFLAARDELTGLVNRRQASELLQVEQRRADRHGSSFCIALIDLDHFKQVNDRHGHAAGDEALRRFAAEGALRVRATDTLARWGGEEFLLLLAESGLPLAREGAERLRLALAGMAIEHGGVRLRLTLSAGVVQYRPGESLVQLLERADAALYRAKAEGRDRVVLGD